MFTTNVGTLDRIVRIIAAVLLVWFVLSGLVTGIAAIIAALVALMLLVTSVVKFCPLYRLFNIHT